MDNNSEYYYRIILAYELPYNVLDSHDPTKVQAKEKLYEELKNLVDKERYEIFSVSLTLHQLHDSFNYLMTYESFFRATTGLPMEEYVDANQIKLEAKKAMEAFFSSLDCDYKQVKIKPLNE